MENNTKDQPALDVQAPVKQTPEPVIDSTEVNNQDAIQTDPPQIQTPEQSNQEQAAAPPVETKKKFKIPSKFFIIGGVVFFILIIIVVIISMLGRVPNVNDIIPSASEEPTATPTPTPAAASPYANDPDVLSIKDQVGEFEKKLNSTSIREDALRVPNLEWEVDFE